MAKKDKAPKKEKKVKADKVGRKADKAAKKAVKKASKKVSKKVDAVPKGMRTVTPQLMLKDSAAAIDFYKEAFGAKELTRALAPDGKQMWHAEIRIGDSVVYLADASPMSAGEAASESHRPTSSIQLYVKDCDSWYERAVAAGCKSVMPMMDMFWGDRMGVVIDPFFQVWAISSRIANLSEKQMRKAGEEFAARMAAQGGGGPPPPDGGGGAPPAQS